MDRIILGKAPEIEIGTTSPTYNRAGNTGLFISKPGANVLSCSDGDLLFDSTASDFIQVLSKGRTVIPAANGELAFAGYTSVETNIKMPYEEENATILATWDLLESTSNLHSDAYSSDWNTSSHSGQYAVVPQSFTTDIHNLGKPNKIGYLSNTPVTVKVFSNTSYFVEPEFSLDPYFEGDLNPLLMSTGGADARWGPVQADGFTSNIGFSGTRAFTGLRVNMHMISADQSSDPTQFPSGDVTFLTDNDVEGYGNAPAPSSNPLNAGRYDDVFGSFSPDGSEIVFSRQDRGPSASGVDVFTVEAAELSHQGGYGLWKMGLGDPATTTTLLARPPTWLGSTFGTQENPTGGSGGQGGHIDDTDYKEPDWNPIDSNKIVFVYHSKHGSTATAKKHIQVFHIAEGTFETLITSHHREGPFYEYFSRPTWSPDGTKIALMKRILVDSLYYHSIWVYDYTLKTKKQVSAWFPAAMSGPGRDSWPSLDWSKPNGKYIRFSPLSSFILPGGIYQIESSGDNPEEFFKLKSSGISLGALGGQTFLWNGVSTSPNGNYILYDFYASSMFSFSQIGMLKTNEIIKTPPTISLRFKNSSPYKNYTIAWTLYRTKGI